MSWASEKATEAVSTYPRGDQRSLIERAIRETIEECARRAEQNCKCEVDCECRERMLAMLEDK